MTGSIHKFQANYRYNQIPLTNIILIDIIPKILSNGKVMKAMDIYETAKNYHCYNGGKEYEGKSGKTHLIKLISGSLNVLKKKGLADSPYKGHWIIKKDTDLPKEKKASNERIENIETTPITTMGDEIKVEGVFGEGVYSVYAYYFPRDKEVAIEKKEKFFQIKIGKTKEDAIKRVWEQTSASSHETPVIALIIKTDHYNELEKLIHGVLKMRKRKIIKIKGNEWFYTNPSELDSIYSFLMYDIHES
jgi:hypothetical protein